MLRKTDPSLHGVIVAMWLIIVACFIYAFAS
jgi:hypothetical protein